MKKHRIYIVDDEELIASTLAVIFQENGYGARYFTHPGTVLEVARDCPPDALVSDYAMPELSGVELARKLFELCPTCRIFMLSATELSLIEACAANAPTPAFRYFGKPVPVVQLLASMADAFNPAKHRAC